MQRSQLSKISGPSNAIVSPGSAQSLFASVARRLPSGVNAGKRPFARIDDEGRLPLRNARIREARHHRAAQVALLRELPARVDARAQRFHARVVFLVREPLLVHVAGRSGRPHATRGPGGRAGARRKRGTIAVGTALERHTGRLHHVELGLNVGLAPRRLRMLPAARGFDEVIRSLGAPRMESLLCAVRRRVCGEDRGDCGGEQC